MSKKLGKKTKQFYIWMFRCIRIIFAFFARKVIFLFAEDLYKKNIREKIEEGLLNENSSFSKKFKSNIEKDVKISYQRVIADLERQIVLVERDRDQWKKLSRSKEEVSQSYWQGVKYGHKLTDKRKSTSSSSLPYEISSANKTKAQWNEWWKSPEAAEYRKFAYVLGGNVRFQVSLTDSNLFALQQVAKGNKLIGCNTSFLEENNYIKPVWDSDTVHHYELTPLGKKYLNDIDDPKNFPIVGDRAEVEE